MTLRTKLLLWFIALHLVFAAQAVVVLVDDQFWLFAVEVFFAWHFQRHVAVKRRVVGHPNVAEVPTSQVLDQFESADRPNRVLSERSGFVGVEQRETAAARGTSDRRGWLIDDEVDRVLAVGTLDVHGCRSGRPVRGAADCHMIPQED